ncbi:glycosyltransferase family 4 protein [Belliella aquatica]|uniref:Glycoside hydrolase n=1 Tax=Belliella aquatica TaxID=1323734 RepID=A0ABQ1M0Z4_9BACT|nr:glycosyltransferase family 4 protein [Belliella aquatica]MCH7407307.1 glycosyltransferase family 4 protein [Belliella aquatica]GGC31612.1 glycoside hydrolase [Belliella aquatica]
MRIGILVESFPRISEAWLANQIIDLVKRGNEVSIYSVYPNSDSIIHQQVKTYNLIEKTHYFFNPKVNTGKRFWLGLGFILGNFCKVKPSKVMLAIKAILTKKIEPLFGFNYIFLKGMAELDILHAHFGEMGVFAAKMKKAGLLGKAKVVVSFHGHDIFPYRREIYKKDYNIFKGYADALLVNSIYSESLLQEIFPFSQVRIIPVGLSLDYFKPEYQLATKVRLVFLGRLVYLKGGLLMVEIFHRLSKKYPQLELVMIGEGEKRNEIENKINEYGLTDSVFLKGALSQDQVINELKLSSIYVYPGLIDPFFKAGETQGLVLQEAQAMELPVVCSDIGGIKYGMVDGETGFLVNEGDVDGFAEKIQLLIDQPELRRKMGKSGRDFVKKHFDSKVIGDQLITVYTEILSKN